MKFDDLDRLMRPYETAYDFCVPMGNHIVIRLDGRGFYPPHQRCLAV